MARGGLMARMPIWVRVPGIIALALVGVLVSAMLLDAADIGGRGGRGGHGSGDTQMDGGGHGPGDSGGRGGSGDETETDSGGHGRSGDGGGHDSGDREERSDHNEGQDAPAEPPEPGSAAAAAHVVAFAMEDTVFVPVKAAVRRGGRA